MKKSLAITALWMLSACSGSTQATPDAGSVEDAAVATGDDAALCRPIPNTPGSQIGRSLRPFTLERCDEGTFSFYDDEFCSEDHRLTVVSAAAGWCGPCQEESRMLTEQIINRYAGQGVRVVQIMVDGVTTGDAPTVEFCREWTRTYNIVGSTQVIDPADELAVIFPDNALPSTILVDRDGTIRHRESGVSEGLSTLRAAIEQILAEEN